MRRALQTPVNRYIGILVLCIVLLVAISVEDAASFAPISAVRIAIGLLFSIFIPGYLVQQVIFPRSKTFDIYERIALSFGLSIAILATYAALVSYSPLTLNEVVVIGVLVAHTVILCGFGIAQSLYLGLEWNSEQSPLQFSTRDKRYYAAIATVLITASIAFMLIFGLRGPAHYFTEFYVLNANGQGENYPTQVVANQPFTLILGIANSGTNEATYTVQILNNGTLIDTQPSISLAVGEATEYPVDIELPEIGELQRLEFVLLDEDLNPINQPLYLQLDVLSNLTEGT